MEYKTLLHLTYEIEGLLMVQLDRPERYSVELDNLIKEKISSLNLLVNGSTPLPIPVQEPVEEEIADSVLMEETEDADIPAEAVVDETPEVKEKEEVATMPVVITTPVQDSALAPSIPVPEEGTVEEKSVKEEVKPAAVAETLDEKIARNKAKDIFKAFTVNDKFRFRRELFRNSQAEFEETLEVIAGMSSMDEAKEYFYEDLCWDPSSEDVKDFMEILDKHF